MKYKNLWIAMDSNRSIVITNCKPINIAHKRGVYNFVANTKCKKGKLIMYISSNNVTTVFNFFTVNPGDIIPFKHLIIIPRY